MKKLFKQVPLYIGLGAVILAVVAAVLQCITTDSNTLISKYAAAKNNGNSKKLAAVMTPSKAVDYLDELEFEEDFEDALKEAFDDIDEEEWEELDEMEAKYYYLPGRSYVNENGEKYIYYFMTPKNEGDDVVRYRTLRVVKEDGKEYLDF